MASYHTHLLGGLATGTLAALIGVVDGHLLPPELGLLVVVGTLGGIAPDVDSDSGHPVRVLFTTGAVALPLAALWRVSWLSETLPRAALAALAIAVFVYWPLKWAFMKLTVHRGAWHSLPAALIFGGGAFLITGRRVDDLDLQLSVGLTAGAGYLSHLILDELYAVDFNGVAFRPKASLGTALKPKGPTLLTTVLLYALVLVVGVLVWQGLDGLRLEELWARYGDHPLVAPVDRALRSAYERIRVY